MVEVWQCWINIENKIVVQCENYRRGAKDPGAKRKVIAVKDARGMGRSTIQPTGSCPSLYFGVLKMMCV